MPVSGLGRFVDRNTIRFDLRYPHPPEAVWRAITDAEALAVWLFPWQIDLRLGGTVLLRAQATKFDAETVGTEPEDVPTGTVTALEVGSVLEISFTGPPNSWPEGFVRFELRRSPDGCELVFMQRIAPDHVWFEPEGQIGGPGTIPPGACAGWHGLLQENLTRFLTGRPVPRSDPSDDALWAERTESYRQMTIAELAP